MKKVILSICICSILLITLTGCGNKQSKDIHNKLGAELEYIEDLIFKIANKYAKKEYIEDDKFKWDYVKGDIQKINDCWSTLVLDLTQVNVSNEDILGFGNDLNDLLISISKESEIAMMNQLNNMYAKIVKFKEPILEDQNRVKKNKIKSDTLAVFVLASENNFEAANREVTNLVENYKKLMSDISYAEQNGYNLNKIYILLEEYRNSIQTGNYDLVRIKYIVTVENL